MKILNSKFEIRNTMQKQIIVLIVFISLIIGILIRLWMLTLKDPVLRWDAGWYYSAGVGVLNGHFPVDCCFHGSGYPMFIAFVLGITRSIDPQIVRIAQIIIDLGTGILLFLSAKKSFGKTSGVITWILYMINPITASYTTLLMTEILTIHIISWIVLVLSSRSFHNTWYAWIGYGALLGDLFLIKPGFLVIIPIGIIGVSIFMIKNIRHMITFLFSAALSSVCMIWFSGYMHYRVFGVFSPSPPYTLSNMTLVYLARHLPILPETIGEMVPGNAEWDAVIYEYHYLIREGKFDEIIRFNSRYKERVLSMNGTDIQILAGNYVRNFVSYWNKRNLFLHVDLLYPRDKKYVQTGNFLLLCAAGVGFVSGFTHMRKNKYFFAFMISLLVYGGMLFPLITNLPRHSLPLYPLVFLFGGKGIQTVVSKLDSIGYRK